MADEAKKYLKALNRLRWVGASIVWAIVTTSILAGIGSRFTRSAPPGLGAILALLTAYVALAVAVEIIILIPYFWRRHRLGQEGVKAVKKEAARRWRVIWLYSLLFHLLLSGGILFSFSRVRECRTAECFIEAAGSCRRAKLVAEGKGWIEWSYRSDGFCRFTKTAARLDGRESPRMKELLEGKSLACAYEKGEFDERWVTSLLYGIENCDGELKETLGKLLFAFF